MVKKGPLTEGASITDYEEYSLPYKSSKGEDVTLSSFTGKKPVVLFFYPKAATPGCTAEVCAFRDDYTKFKEAGAEVFGMSSDDVSANSKFATDRTLPYPLLSDPNGTLRKAFGVKSSLMGLIPGRQTFVISTEGKVLLSFNDQLRAKKHVENALKVLQSEA